MKRALFDACSRYLMGAFSTALWWLVLRYHFGSQEIAIIPAACLAAAVLTLCTWVVLLLEARNILPRTVIREDDIEPEDKS